MNTKRPCHISYEQWSEPGKHVPLVQYLPVHPPAQLHFKSVPLSVHSPLFLHKSVVHLSAAACVHRQVRIRQLNSTHTKSASAKSVRTEHMKSKYLESMPILKEPKAVNLTQVDRSLYLALLAPALQLLLALA